MTLTIQCDSYEQSNALRTQLLHPDFTFRACLAYVNNPVALRIGNRLDIHIGEGFKADGIETYCKGYLAGYEAGRQFYCLGKY